MPDLWLLLAGWYALLSGVTYLAYAHDKRRSGGAGRRVSELTLHTLELLGGWPGAYLAASRLRHKSRKRSFRVKRAAVTLLNLAALVAVLYVRSRLA